MEHDLLVIGAGHLGGRVAQQWRQLKASSRVLAETRTPKRHEALAREGLQVRTRDSEGPPVFPNVLFSVPPSATDSYEVEAARATSLWSTQGRLVMTSSTAVYAENGGGTCEEDSPVDSSPRASRLLAAEEVIRRAGGIIVRLSGLYDLERGPHRVYLRTERSERRPDGIVNLIHYDDAAALCVRILITGEPGQVYLGCDSHPVTRREMVDTAYDAASVLAADSKVHRCAFTGTTGPKGRRCDNHKTRELLDWNPKYPHFASWVEEEIRAQHPR